MWLLTFTDRVVVVILLAFVAGQSLKVGHTVTRSGIVVTRDSVRPVIVAAARCRQHHQTRSFHRFTIKQFPQMCVKNQ